MSFAVRTEGVVKTFGKGAAATRALKGASLTVKPGEMHMLVGPSGCGKTTLLSVIAGTLFFDEGLVEVMGENLGTMKRSKVTAFRARTIGFIFQQYNLIPALNAMENVSIPMLLNGFGRGVAEKRARETLEQVGLKDKFYARSTQLSGGQQQRVAIARALVHDPRLVICDEPTSALDSETGGHVIELLRGIARQNGRAVLIVTHDSRIFRHADRISEMEDGVVLPPEAHRFHTEDPVIP